MPLYNLEKTNKSYGTMYNVEYMWGNGKHHTFSGILENVDEKSFWFEIDGCISKVSQDRIVWMIPTPIKHV